MPAVASRAVPTTARAMPIARFFLVAVLMSMGVAPSTALAATLRVRVTAARLQSAAAAARATAPGVADKVAPQAGAPSERVVLCILLAPEQELHAVHAPWPATVLGTSFYHGYGIAAVAVRRADLVAHASEGATLELETGAVTAVVHPRRADALRELDVRRELTDCVVNPDELANYSAPLLTATPPAAAGFKPTEAPSLEGSAVQMLILTRDALVPSFQAYADYKTGTGVPTVVRSVEWVLQNYPHGADVAETLRDFFRQAYQLWGIRSVLIGGDTDLVPARYASSVYSLEGESVPTDLYYGCLDGNWNGDRDARWGEGFVYVDNTTDNADLLPELWVGRLPVVNSTQVQMLLAKLQAYCEPTVLDYQNKMGFLAEVIWPASYKAGDPILKNGADNAERLIILNHLDTAGRVLSRLDETPQFYPGAIKLTRAVGLAAMNAGQSIVTHIGHGFRYSMSLGDASASIADALGLQNATRPFFLHMLNCSAAAFDFPCLAEKFLLCPTGGAIGVIGSAREAYPDNIQVFQEAWFNALYSQGYPGAAECLHQARLKYVAQTFDDNAFRWSYFITAYLGDPELTLWTNTPRTIAVTHAPNIFQGVRTFTVTVTEAGNPVQGATVCLWKPGDFYVVGRTGLTGVAALNLTAEVAGTAHLAVTGAGVRPYRAEVTVTPYGGAVLHSTGAIQVVDSGVGTAGNGNAVLEAGEAAQVRFEIENAGTLPAEGVTLQAFCTEPALLLSTSIANVGTMAAGQRIWSGPVVVNVAAGAFDQQRVGIDLVLKTVQSTQWNDRVSLDLLQVSPRVQRIWVDDSVTGNGDAVAQANETYDLRVELKNYGFAQLAGATGQLLSLDPDVTIVNGSTTFGSIGHLGVGTGAFRIRESNVTQNNRMLLVVLDAQARTWSLPVETRRPQPLTGLVGDPSDGSGVTTLTWGKSVSSDVAGYVVYRAPHNYGPWLRASTDLVRNSTYFRDEGLQPGTQYFYSVAAVDSAGNESLRTMSLGVTTNPGALAGWPQTLGLQSNCSPAVADLDGDGHVEVVAGAADHFYAWHVNGTEVRDGDSNAATQGVYTPTTANFMPGLAVGDLDGDGRDEVVACTFDTKTVYVFGPDGTVRPGWPHSIVSTTHSIWATPALADLDLDGRLEIVLLALDGRVYAWHADGTEVRDGDADPATNGVFYAIPGLPTWSRGGPAVANVLPSDPTPEIIFGTENGKVYVLRANGTVAPGWPRTLSDKVDASPSIGDIDHDGTFEIVVPCVNGQLYVFRPDGTDAPGWPRPLPNLWAALTPSVALADFDGDGKLELVAASTGSDVSTGSLYMFDSNGNVRPGWPVDVHSASESSPVVGDLNGDGVMEIVYGGESGILNAFNPNGTIFPGFPVRLGAEVRATPLLTDADGDGRVDLIVSGWDQQVYAWHFPGLYVRHRVPWGTLKGNLLRNGLTDYRLPTDVGDGGTAPAFRTGLQPNIPNPFNPTTLIRFDVGGTAAQFVALQVFDVRGARVRTLVARRLLPGHYDATWDGHNEAGRSVASGVYFYRLTTGDASMQRKMILVR